MFTEDLSVFFNTAEFASQASALNAQEQLVSFAVIFDAPSASEFGGMVGDVAPRATCKTADVADVVWQSGITIGATAYTVSTISPDGTGVTTLTLREA